MDFYLTTSASTFPCFQINWTVRDWHSLKLDCKIGFSILREAGITTVLDLDVSPSVGIF